MSENDLKNLKKMLSESDESFQDQNLSKERLSCGALEQMVSKERLRMLVEEIDARPEEAFSKQEFWQILSKLTGEAFLVKECDYLTESMQKLKTLISSQRGS